eukprot:TRINITY_DN9826_c0_g1_i8.p1 TRINITY_DN9826_c0_g1~~TRINITY_DN9826_c0_g1_i8.p1  ORF type:complete len:852 (-),score=144.61 TRINITY_DN9826_c0_g1_i8:434-2989(-)
MPDEKFVRGIMSSPMAIRVFPTSAVQFPSANQGGKKKEVPETPTVDESGVISIFPLNLAPFLSENSFTTSAGREELKAMQLPMLSSVTITCSLSGPLLSEELKLKLNPLTLTIEGAVDLPDRPLSFEQLTEKCQPVYCSWKFFLDDRVYRTNGVVQASHISWKQQFTYILGSPAPEEIVAAFETQPLVIEVHDRDLPKSQNSSMDSFGIATFSLADCIYGKVNKSISSQILPHHPSNRMAVDFSARPRPGHYIEFGSQLKIHVHIPCPLTNQAEKASFSQGPFNRVLYIARNDSLEMRKLCQQVEANNLKVLGLEQAPAGSLDNYKFTTAQHKDPSLDVVTGFRLIDSKYTIVCLEGISSGFLRQLPNTPKENKDGDDGMVIVSNPKVLFRERKYAIFNAVIKVIKLREPLNGLVTGTDIYVQPYVPQDACTGLVLLQQLRQTQRLRQAARMNIFPSPSMLESIERKFGSALTDDDLYKITKDKTSFIPSDKQARVEEQKISSASMLKITTKGKATKAETEATDSNPGFSARTDPMSARKYEPTKVRETSQPKEKPVEQHKEPLEYLEEIEGRPVFMYSSQRLNARELQKTEIRRKIASDTRHNYTYSLEFASGAFAKADPLEELRKEEMQKTTKWTTKDGFLPFKKLQNTAAYDRIHPKQPSEYRVDDLSLPYMEASDVRKHFERDLNQNPFPDRPEFKVAAHNIPPHFGPKELFKSVHLCGTSLLEEREEAIKREQELWKSKVIVDSTVFHVDKSRHHAQSDRWRTLLRDPPTKKALKLTAVDSVGPTQLLAESYPLQSTSPNRRPETHPKEMNGSDFRLYGTQSYDNSSLNHLSRRRPIIPRVEGDAD